MLYPYRDILRHRVPLAQQPSWRSRDGLRGDDAADSENIEDAGDLAQSGEQFSCFLEIIHVLSQMFGVSPTAMQLPGSSTVTLLFRDVTYLWQDIPESVGDLAVSLASGSVDCPLRFYGTTEDRETAELTIYPEGGDGIVQLRSVSGQMFDHLQGLGVQMDFATRDTAETLIRLVSTDPFCSPCAVVPERDAGLLRRSHLLARTPGSRFSYLCWESLSTTQLLSALKAHHKALLWRDFLEDGREPLEFEWLWEGYYAREPQYLLEWELALRMVLEELHYQVERTETHFRVLDPQGRERRFDIVRGGPAEKMFLKLLFPMDNKETTRPGVRF